MAEQYYPGIRRIFYKASSFKTGLTVTAKIFDKNLNCICVNAVFTETTLIGGLYYFDRLLDIGEYLIVFYENGTKTLVQSYNIVRETKSIIGSFPGGDKLINI